MRAESLARCAILACLCLLTACTQWRYDLGTPLARTDYSDAFSQMSLAEVLVELGPPQRVASTDSGFVLAWEHWLVDEDTFGLRLGFVGADIVSIDWGKADVRGEFLLLTFDRERRLSGGAYSEWDSKFGGGQGVQPLFGFVSLVEVDDLVRRMPQHRWGMGALKTLPETLNRDYDPETGQAGLEQRGTPTGVGQNTLEMD